MHFHSGSDSAASVSSIDEHSRKSACGFTRRKQARSSPTPLRSRTRFISSSRRIRHYALGFTPFFIPGADCGGVFAGRTEGVHHAGSTSARSVLAATPCTLYSPLLPLVTELAGTANAVCFLCQWSPGLFVRRLSEPRNQPVQHLRHDLWNRCIYSQCRGCRPCFRSLPDGVHAIGFDPPGVDVFAIRPSLPLRDFDPAKLDNLPIRSYLLPIRRSWNSPLPTSDRATSRR